MMFTLPPETGFNGRHHHTHFTNGSIERSSSSGFKANKRVRLFLCGRNGGVSQVVFKKFQGPLTVFGQPGWQFNARARECNSFWALWSWASQGLSGGIGNSKAAQKCTEGHLVLEIKSGPNYSRYALQILCYLPSWEPRLIAQPFYILQAMWEKLTSPHSPLLRI